MRRTAALLGLAFGLGAGSTVAQTVTPPQATTIIFVRHAEAGTDDPRDPSLAPEGVQRAEALAKALSSAGIAAVYTSQYKRTMQTGAPVAAAAKLTAVVVPVAGATLEKDAEALIARILRDHAGKTVLVVGHSNTVPLMVLKAANIDAGPISEKEFDRLYTVILRDGESRVIRGRY